MERIDVLTMLNLLIHEHCISVHVFTCLISFISVLQFQHVSLVHILLDSHLSISFILLNLNGIVVLILVSMCSWIIHRNTIDFCMLLLYPEISWTHLLVLWSFYRFLGIFYVDNHSMSKYGQFYFFFSVLYAPDMLPAMSSIYERHRDTG